MLRAARLLSLLGGAVAVLALSKVHAAYIAVPAYDFTGGPRIWWALPYIGLIALATYAVGLPDQPQHLFRAAWLSFLAGAGAALGALRWIASLYAPFFIRQQQKLAQRFSRRAPRS